MCSTSVLILYYHLCLDMGHAAGDAVG
jgi:hypothetical protein